MAGMLAAVSYPPQFETIDRIINTADKTELDRFIARLAKVGFGFGTGGVLAADADAKIHWETDWVGDPFGTGPRVSGAYWPYLDKIDVADRLRDGLLTSVTKVLDTFQTRPKRHRLSWACGAIPPDSWVTSSGAGAPVPKADQQRMFNVAFVESADMIVLQISTPFPLPDAKRFASNNDSSRGSVARSTTGVPTYRDNAWWQESTPTGFVWHRASVDATVDEIRIRDDAGFSGIQRLEGEAIDQ